jgi:hypothetical protein
MSLNVTQSIDNMFNETNVKISHFMYLLSPCEDINYHMVLKAHNSNFKIMYYINKYIFRLYGLFKLLTHSW